MGAGSLPSLLASRGFEQSAGLLAFGQGFATADAIARQPQRHPQIVASLSVASKPRPGQVGFEDGHQRGPKDGYGGARAARDSAGKARLRSRLRVRLEAWLRIRLRAAEPDLVSAKQTDLQCLLNGRQTLRPRVRNIEWVGGSHLIANQHTSNLMASFQIACADSVCSLGSIVGRAFEARLPALVSGTRSAKSRRISPGKLTARSLEHGEASARGRAGPPRHLFSNQKFEQITAMDRYGSL